MKKLDSLFEEEQKTWNAYFKVRGQVNSSHEIMPVIEPLLAGSPSSNSYFVEIRTKMNCTLQYAKESILIMNLKIFLPLKYRN